MLRPQRATGTALAGIALLAACQVAPDPATAYDSEAVQSEVLAALRAFEAAEKTRSPDAVIAFLDPEFTMLADGKRYDYAQTTAQMRESLPALRAFEPRFDDVRVLTLGPTARSHPWSSTT